MIKRIGIVVLAVILVSLFSGCTEMSADQIAQKMKEKQDSIKDFSATMVMSSSFTGKSESVKATIKNKMPGKSRMEYLEPSEIAGQVMVSDGKTIWTYDPKKNEATKMELPDIGNGLEQDYSKYIKELLNQTDISYKGTEKFEGRSVYLVTASPKNADMMMGVRYSMLVDSETWMPLKIDMFDKNDKPMVSIEYREIKFNTGIPDSEFEFKVPAGAKVVTQGSPVSKEMTIEEARKQVNFTVLSPSYIPAGYTFKSATVMKFDRTEMVNLMYLNAAQTLFITEKIKEDTPDYDMGDIEKISVSGVEGKLISQPFGGKILIWSSAGLDFMLSADLGREELIKVAASMK